MNDPVYTSTPGGLVKLVDRLVPSVLKTVMKKTNEDGKSYCHFYYLLWKERVFLTLPTPDCRELSGMYS